MWRKQWVRPFWPWSCGFLGVWIGFGMMYMIHWWRWT